MSANWLRSRASSERGAGSRKDRTLEESSSEVSLDELREFLAADSLDVHADPKFKERLRRRLWDMVVARSGPAGRRED